MFYYAEDYETLAIGRDLFCRASCYSLSRRSIYADPLNEERQVVTEADLCQNNDASRFLTCTLRAFRRPIL